MPVVLCRFTLSPCLCTEKYPRGVALADADSSTQPCKVRGYYMQR